MVICHSCLSRLKVFIAHIYYRIYVIELFLKQFAFLVKHIYFLSLFIYLEREKPCTSRGGAERERERERIPRRLPAASTESDMGLGLMNREIMTWAEIRVRCLTD